MTLFLCLWMATSAMAADETLWSAAELVELGVPGPPRTSPDVINEMTEEVSAGLRCPVCQGMPVSESPAKPAITWKNAIRDLVTMGYSAEQIEEFFIRRHGEWVLLRPRLHGVNWILWLLPYLLFGAALALLGVFVTSSGRKEQTADGDSEGTGEYDAYEAQILAEVDDE